MEKVYTGKDGKLLINGIEQLKVASWQLNGKLELLETTNLADSQRSYIPGVQDFTGTARILYSQDSEGQNSAAIALKSIIRTAGVDESDVVTLCFRLVDNNQNYDVVLNAYINNVSYGSSAGEATYADIEFQSTGSILEAAIVRGQVPVGQTNAGGNDAETSRKIKNGDVDQNAEIAVSKLANGFANQVLTTSSNGTTVTWSNNINLPGTLNVQGLATLASLQVNNVPVITANQPNSVTDGMVVSANSAKILFDQNVSTSETRTVKDRLQEVVSIKDFGADASGIEDATQAIQAALNYVNALGGGTVYIPAGTYRKSDLSPTLVMYSNTRLKGDGDASIIYHEDLPANPRKDLLVADNTENIAFEDFKIQGTLATYTTETNQSQTLNAINVVNMRISNVTIKSVRFMATAFSRVRGATVIGCKLIDILRDGIRFTHSQDIVITGNTFSRVADDAVALHALDDNATPAQSGLTITGNVFEESQGIKVLGAKLAIISDNTMRRMLRLPITVDSTIDLPEGNTPVFCVKITNNIITDTFYNFNAPTLSGGYAIKCKIRPRSKGALTSQPGYVSDVSPYNWANNIDAPNSVSIGAWGVSISNNIVATTLPTQGISFYSDYGYDNILDRQGGSFGPGFYNPAITSTFFAVTGIYFEGPVRGLSIDSNVLSGGGVGTKAIEIAGHDDANGIDRDGCLVTNNIITDWPGTGITLSTSGVVSAIAIRNNWLDLDPLFRHSTHASNNTWSSTTSVYGISAVSENFGIAAGNTFMHMANVTSNTDGFCYENNYVVYDPNGTTGLNGPANCRGVRNVPDTLGFTCLIYDGNPSSATFKKITTVPKLTANTRPTAGTYVAGHIVRNTVPSVVSPGAGQEYSVFGWQRLTTGSSHTLNTDWKELRCLTGL